MDFVTFTIEPIFRWMHILAGIIWIGHLYFFNFVNGPFAATMNADTKKAVVPELMPRALYWFRWGAAWTWATGVILLMLVFYHGKAIFMGGTGAWGITALISLGLTFGGFLIYDAIQNSSAGDQKMKNSIFFGLVALVVFFFSYGAGMGYRGWVIHVGAMLGTAMAFNVWFRIWPAQQQIITAVKNGQAPDAALVGMAGMRSRHNTYMSAALIWTMIDTHTQAFVSVSQPVQQIAFLVMVGLAWHVVFQLYKKAGQVKGF